MNVAELYRYLGTCAAGNDVYVVINGERYRIADVNTDDETVDIEAVEA